jgi:hypothetical protein
MKRFNALELAALKIIAENYPELKPQLIAMFDSSIVTRRENTGNGFFTEFLAADMALPPIVSRSPLGDAWISVENMVHGICCLVHQDEGIPNLLEGYSPAGEDTSLIDFDDVNFTVKANAPPWEVD